MANRSYARRVELASERRAAAEAAGLPFARAGGNDYSWWRGLSPEQKIQTVQAVDPASAAGPNPALVRALSRAEPLPTGGVAATVPNIGEALRAPFEAAQGSTPVSLVVRVVGDDGRTHTVELFTHGGVSPSAMLTGDTAQNIADGVSGRAGYGNFDAIGEVTADAILSVQLVTP